MLFERITTGGCRSYLIGYEESCVATLIDPALQQLDRYLGLAARDGVRICYVIDMHTHADHFSAARQVKQALNIPAIMHRNAPALFADMRLEDGDVLILVRGTCRAGSSERQDEGMARAQLSDAGSDSEPVVGAHEADRGALARSRRVRAGPRADEMTSERT